MHMHINKPGRDITPIAIILDSVFFCGRSMCGFNCGDLVITYLQLTVSNNLTGIDIDDMYVVYVKR